jgi:hypothetical protein
MRSLSDWKITFRIFGAISIAFALAVLGTISAASQTILRNRGVDVREFSIELAVWFVIAGIGLLRPTRWGAVLLAAPLAALLIWWLCEAFLRGAYISALMAFVMSPLFVGPAYITFRRWFMLAAWW